MNQDGWTEMVDRQTDSKKKKNWIDQAIDQLEKVKELMSKHV